MILKIVLLCFFSAIIGSNVDGLSCNQGQFAYGTNVSLPVQCPMAAYSCMFSIDWSQTLATVACQTTNCTMPGSYNITTSDICYNTSGYPPQTFCCCYGDGCNGNRLTRMYASIPPPQQISLQYNLSVCLPRGTWGNWRDWSECPNSADPIFELLSDINMQTRIRDCLPQPTGCIRNGTGTFMCDGQHWEQRPCAKRPSGNGTATNNFMPSGFMTMPNGSG